MNLAGIHSAILQVFEEDGTSVIFHAALPLKAAKSFLNTSDQEYFSIDTPEI